jgi:hypothetical protein
LRAGNPTELTYNGHQSISDAAMEQYFIFRTGSELILFAIEDGTGTGRFKTV